jgi:hypothetical protein
MWYCVTGSPSAERAEVLPAEDVQILFGESARAFEVAFE